MAPRANWKGFLRLSLVTCPVALYPATSESEKVSFNQLNRKTGHRIKYAKVDADTGEEVSNEDIVKGYKVDTDTFIEVTKEELENVALESTRTIEIDEFVDRSEIDPRYLPTPATIRPLFYRLVIFITQRGRVCDCVGAALTPSLDVVNGVGALATATHDADAFVDR